MHGNRKIPFQLEFSTDVLFLQPFQVRGPSLVPKSMGARSLSPDYLSSPVVLVSRRTDEREMVKLGVVKIEDTHSHSPKFVTRLC